MANSLKTLFPFTLKIPHGVQFRTPKMTPERHFLKTYKNISNLSCSKLSVKNQQNPTESVLRFSGGGYKLLKYAKVPES